METDFKRLRTVTLDVAFRYVIRSRNIRYTELDFFFFNSNNWYLKVILFFCAFLHFEVQHLVSLQKIYEIAYLQGFVLIFEN